MKSADGPSSVEVRKHYDEHLGPIYAWMTGPFETASLPSTRLFEELGLEPGSSGVAVDLGCGHGLQSVALAERGYRVVAIDTCPVLLRQLEGYAASLPVQTVQADITNCEEHIPAQIDLVVCMGDTLPHLPSPGDVADLIRRFAAALVPGGTFVVTFRDYVSSPLEGRQRFIPVRSDEDRMLTCFLEYQEGSVRVYDLIHERSESGWDLTVSSYEKLRLEPGWVAARMRESGLRIVVDRTDRGMVTLCGLVPTLTRS